MSSQNDGCNWYRVFVPSRHFKRFKVCRSVENFDNYQPELKKDPKTIKFLEQADIISLQRLASLSVIFFIDGLRRIKPRKVVFDCDDLVEKIYKDNLGSLFFNKERIEIFDEIIKNCDMLSVSTKFLAEQWKNKNKNVVVLPNALDFDYIKEVKKDYSPNKRLKILVSGSCLYQENLSHSLIETLNEIAKDKKYQLILFGVPLVDEESLKDLRKENREFYYKIRNFLETIEQIKGAEKIPNVPFGRYYETLIKIDADIALIPRGNHDFNKAKSNLKILEMSAFKIPCIVSPMLEYQEFIDKNLVLKAEKKEDWLKAISQLEKPEIRQELAIKCYDYVKKNYNIKKVVKIWENAYLSLYGKTRKNEDIENNGE